MIIEMKDKRVSNVTSDGIFRLPLERDVLPRYLRACRWYASKDDAAPSVTVEKSLTISDLPDAKVLILGVKTNEAAKRYLFPTERYGNASGPRPVLFASFAPGPPPGGLSMPSATINLCGCFSRVSAELSAHPRRWPALFFADLRRSTQVAVSRKAISGDPVRSSPIHP